MKKDDGKIIISLEIPEELKEQLRVRAFNERLTMSALIRKILTEEVEKVENKDNSEDK